MVLSEVFYFISNVMYSLFLSLDSVYIDSYSLLDIFISIILLKLIIWFVRQFLGLNSGGVGKTVNEVAAPYHQSANRKLRIYQSKGRISYGNLKNKIRGKK